MSNPKKRLHFVDSIKGLAMFLVILGHSGTNNYFYNGLYYIHLAIFIMISGFLLSYNYSWKDKSILNNIIHKSSQLLYPYIMFGLLTSLYWYMQHVMVGKTYSFYTTLYLLGILENGANWFLPILFISEILFITYIKLVGDKKHILFMLVTSFFVVFVAHDLKDSLELKSFPWYLVIITGRIFTFILFLGVGYLIKDLVIKSYKHNEYSVSSKIYLILSIVMLIISSNLEMVDLHFIHWNNTFLYFLVSILGAGSFILFFSSQNINVRYLNYIGKNSLAINGTHTGIGIVLLSHLILKDVSNGLSNITTLYPFLVALLTVLIECLVILPIINKAFPFIINLKLLTFESKL